MITTAKMILMIMIVVMGVTIITDKLSFHRRNTVDKVTNFVK